MSWEGGQVFHRRDACATGPVPLPNRLAESLIDEGAIDLVGRIMHFAKAPKAKKGRLGLRRKTPIGHGLR
jgi:hypothetical protein